MATNPGPAKLLLAFDYAVQKRFEEISEIILKYIYKKSEMQINLRRNLTTKFPVVLVENEFNSTEEQLAEHLNRLTTIVPIVVPILFTLVIVIGFIGNLLVVLVVLLNKTMRNTTNILIFNLAVRRKCLELVQNM